MESLTKDKPISSEESRVLYKIFKTSSWEDSIEHCMDYINQKILPHGFKLLDVGMTCSGGNSIDVMCFCIFESVQSDTNQQKKLEVSYRQTDEGWGDSFQWIQVEASKVGTNFFRHAYSILSGESNFQLLAVFYWAEKQAMQQKYKVSFARMNNWVGTQKAFLEDFEKNCMFCEPVDIKAGCCCGNSDALLTMVSIPDRPKQHYFTLDRFSFSGTQPDSLQEIIQRLQMMIRQDFISVGYSLRVGCRKDQFTVFIAQKENKLDLKLKPIGLSWMKLREWKNKSMLSDQIETVVLFEGTSFIQVGANTSWDQSKAEVLEQLFWNEGREDIPYFKDTGKFWFTNERRELQVVLKAGTEGMALWQLVWKVEYSGGTILVAFMVTCQTPLGVKPEPY